MKTVLSTVVAIFLLGCSESTTESIKEITTDAKKLLQESTQSVEVKSSIDETRTDIVKAIKPVKQKASVDGATLYKTCIACHGANAEKKALNKSQIIQGWESSKIVEALKGYKDGTYGGSMKGVMKPQVSKLSDAEIDVVAKHISSL